MRTEAKIFAFVAGFFLVVTPIYYFMSHEIAGTFVLGLTAALGLIVAGYLALVARKIDLRPEDRGDGDVHEGAGELGFFPPHSIWPVICAGVLSIFLMGPIFGWWLSLLGLGLGIWALAGWIFEYYRGDYAH